MQEHSEAMSEEILETSEEYFLVDSHIDLAGVIHDSTFECTNTLNLASQIRKDDLWLEVKQLVCLHILCDLHHSSNSHNHHPLSQI